MPPAVFRIPAFLHNTQGLGYLEIRTDLLLEIQRRGPGWKHYEFIGSGEPTVADSGEVTLAGSSVCQVVADPIAIFGGIREHQAGGLCYCGRPKQKWTEEGVLIP